MSRWALHIECVRHVRRGSVSETKTKHFASKAAALEAFGLVRNYYELRLVDLRTGTVLKEKYRCSNCGDPTVFKEDKGLDERRSKGWCSACFRQWKHSTWVDRKGRRHWKT